MPAKTTESILAEQNAMTIAAANTIVITNMQQFGDAQIFLTELVNRRKVAENFFKPLKQSAKKAHSDLCQREKLMIEPLKEAEDKLRDAMETFADAYEKDKAKAEQEQRIRNEQEADRLRAEAEVHENEGNVEAAEMCREMATTVSSSAYESGGE